MYTITDKFKAALVDSHTVVSRADLHVGPTLVVSNLPVVSGTVTEDATALIRTRCNIELAATADVMALLPLTPPLGGSLWPLGNELRLYSGIDFEDGTAPELVPQGVFRINKPMTNDSGAELTVTVEGYDRARSVSRSKFIQPYTVAAGTNYATAIKNLIKSRLAVLTDADFSFMATAYTTPQLIFTPDDDPWQMACDMARSIGAELFWGNTGLCVLSPEPDPLYTPPMWTYAEGVDATMLGVGRGLDDEQAFNGVIVTSENSTLATPIRAEAWDLNPDSPTYYDPAQPQLSKYGPVPFQIKTQLITTQDQANVAAAVNLARKLGIIENVSLSAINNPAHAANDVIRITRARANIDNVYILDSVTKGLGVDGDCTAVCRSRRTA